MRKISTFVRMAIVLMTATLSSTLNAVAQNTVTDWNAIAITQARASTAPGATSAGGTSLYLAYLQLAVYNAVNAIDGRFQPYKYMVTAPPGTSADAAAIEAAYRVLLYLLPDRAVPLTTQYKVSMAAIPDGSAKSNGQLVGQASAGALIALRAGDGRGVPWPYAFPSTPVPGVWILTPGTSVPATPWVGQMRPFTFDSPDQFLPDEPPPDLGSQTWTDDFNQTKTLGAINSLVRTPEQTEIGLFWTDHTASQYGGTLRGLVKERNLDLADSARLLAMSYTAIADSFIGCFNAKYHFSFWRPVTAIRNADIDGNPDTIADPAWTPLATTPGHPEYPAAHGCVTGALTGTLQAFFGTPNVQMTVNSMVTGSAHNFRSVHDLEKEVEWARIYAGFHYHHSLIQGFVLGHKVAHNLVNNYFQPAN
jgi:hypothetical protein